MLHIKAARYVAGYVIWLAFDDGTSGYVDLKDSLWGPVFLPLQDVGFFSQVALDPELETLVWPNGADFAPEFLKELYRQQESVQV